MNKTNEALIKYIQHHHKENHQKLPREDEINLIEFKLARTTTKESSIENRKIIEISSKD
jgi:hypothetical protein